MTTKTAIVKQIQGITFAGKSDLNHWVVMDGPPEFGGSDGGIRSKELLLLALGGCTGSDVVSILQRKRVKLDRFEVLLTAELTEEHPQVFSKVHLEYVFYGDNIRMNDVERAIELSQTKYCSVSAMLKKSMNISHSYRIESAPKQEKEMIDLTALTLT